MQTVTIDNSRTWTAADYQKLEEDVLCQLINGELIMSPAPNPYHQKVLLNLFRIFDRALYGKGEIYLSPIDVYFDNKNVYQPDLIFISKEKLEQITKRGIEGTPDLILEVISPASSFIDRNAKKKKYLASGVTEYWIVDPGNKTIEVYLSSVENYDEPAAFATEEGAILSPRYNDLKFRLEEVFKD